MALDASIIGAGIPAPQPVSITGALETAGKLEDLKAQVLQRQAAADNLRAQAQARIDAAKDQADINSAVQAHGGDYNASADWLDQNGNVRAATTLRTTVTKARKDAADAMEAENKSHAGQIGLGLGLFNAVTDEQTEAQAEQIVSQMSPDVAKVIQSLPKEMPWEQRRDALTSIGLSGKEITDNRQKAIEAARDGKWDDALGRWLSTTHDQASADQVLQGAQHMGVPADIINRFKSVGPWSPEAVKQWGQMALTPEKQATLDEQKAALAQTTANEAANLKVRQGELAVSQGNLAARQKEAATAGAGPGQASDAVQAYADDLKTGNIAITAVPASGGMRNAVIGQLRKEGYDLSRPLTAQTQARVEFSKAVLPQVGEVRDMAQQLNKLGLMGTVGGRWRELVSGESSASSLSGLTDEQKRLVGKFSTQAGLLLSGMAMAHGGARGGGSFQMVEQMKTLLDPKGKDLQTYLGNLDAAENVLGGYAALTPTSGNTPAASSSSGGVSTAVQKALGNQKPGEYELSDGHTYHKNPDGSVTQVK